MTSTTEARTDAAIVAAAVEELGPLDREALLLRVHGRTLGQIATTTGTTIAMVRVRIHRGAGEVERTVGTFPLDDHPLPPDSRATEDQVLDAELGITPVLHRRLRAAVAATRAPARPRHRHLAELRQAIVDRAPRLGPAAGALGAATVVGIALGALV